MTTADVAQLLGAQDDPHNPFSANAVLAADERAALPGEPELRELGHQSQGLVGVELTRSRAPGPRTARETVLIAGERELPHRVLRRRPLTGLQRRSPSRPRAGQRLDDRQSPPHVLQSHGSSSANRRATPRIHSRARAKTWG